MYHELTIVYIPLLFVKSLLTQSTHYETLCSEHKFHLHLFISLFEFYMEVLTIDNTINCMLQIQFDNR